jgi:glycosyltransferase involved in cell wall biosynthesis
MSTAAWNLEDTKLSIIVPVFNEANQILGNLDLLLDEVERYFTSFEVIVVSDGSTDGTNAKLLSLRHPDVRPIIVDQNVGKGHAVRAGFLAASGDYVLFIDGGMEIHPREIRIFMGLMTLYQCDIVVGSKRHPQSRVRYPWYRRLLSWNFQLLVQLLFKIHVTDTQVGIKLFRRDVIDAILPHLKIKRYGFDLELLSLARRLGFDDILEAPIRMDYFQAKPRFVGTDLFHVFRVGLSLLRDTFRLYWRLRKVDAKLRPQSTASKSTKRSSKRLAG